MALLFFILGLICLIIGAELLVRGSSRLAAALHISPLVIGLTVVAFGTSSPELAVSIKSVLSGQSGIAVGNVIGSNIFNILFILGISAIITPLAVSLQLIRIDVPLMIVISTLAFFLALDQSIGRIDGIFLFTTLIIYIVFLIRQSRKTAKKAQQEYEKEFGELEKNNPHTVKNIIFIILGLFLLGIGSKWLVDSAVIFARYFEVSEIIIGITIVAIGTSLPEVVTSIVASIRKERDIAVGNIIGSNLFNILAVLGISGIVAPHGISIPTSVLQFDFPIMIGVAIICLPLFFSGFIVSRLNGALLLSFYFLYTIYLILDAANYQHLTIFNQAFLYGALPLTILGLLLLTVQELNRRKK